jgi:F420 biosynthesis protein FbiB-like protein
MDTFRAIATRRSIRRFTKDPLPREVVERILAATVQAPSAKNYQPWRFVVLEGEHHDRLATMMLEAATSLKAQGVNIGSLEGTARAMLGAPLTVVVFNTAPPPEVPAEAHDDWHWVMAQSTGGAIQTMLLAAQALGVGSLWICDILYVSSAVREWLGHPHDPIVAAVTLGYADEAPKPRPRRPWQEVTEWWSAD